MIGVSESIRDSGHLGSERIISEIPTSSCLNRAVPHSSNLLAEPLRLVLPLFSVFRYLRGPLVGLVVRPDLRLSHETNFSRFK